MSGDGKSSYEMSGRRLQVERCGVEIMEPGRRDEISKVHFSKGPSH